MSVLLTHETQPNDYINVVKSITNSTALRIYLSMSKARCSLSGEIIAPDQLYIYAISRQEYQQMQTMMRGYYYLINNGYMVSTGIIGWGYRCIIPCLGSGDKVEVVSKKTDFKTDIVTLNTNEIVRIERDIYRPDFSQPVFTFM